MLNISNNRIKESIKKEQFRSFSMIAAPGKNVFMKITILLFLVGLVMMFLPWTQNIRARGYVTTLAPDQRPQTIHSVIPGRIEKWFVREGDFVKKGDTIMFISEVKAQYLDPDLLDRTNEQLKSKELSVSSYMEKIKALDAQIDALIENKQLKFEQAKNKLRQADLKIKSDSIALQSSIANYQVTQKQLKRTQSLYEKGLKSLNDVESKKVSEQKGLSKKIDAENKLLTSRNELLNAQMQITSIEAEYDNKIAKAESDKYTALSNMYDAEAVVTKLQNQYMNYSIRSGLYYITAPQDGYITKAIQAGIGQTIKEGAAILSIMPAEYELAVSMYVRPIDLPLINMGEHVRLQFDGWPAIVFRGWPNASYGTFGGTIVAIDNFISPNGKYRVIIAPDGESQAWPLAIRVGAGANTITLLEDVPIWFELWRQFNGFPTNYYQAENHKKKVK